MLFFQLQAKKAFQQVCGRATGEKSLPASLLEDPLRQAPTAAETNPAATGSPVGEAPAAQKRQSFSTPSAKKEVPTEAPEAPGTTEGPAGTSEVGSFLRFHFLKSPNVSDEEDFPFFFTSGIRHGPRTIWPVLKRVRGRLACPPGTRSCLFSTVPRSL